jgi:CRP/FNR family cyclic AMP-dependent transcriptional regulator
VVDIGLLAGHALTRGLGADQLQRLAACGRSVHFAPGAEVFREGGMADTLYLLLAGRIVLFQHVTGRGPVQLEDLRAGDILGLSWMFPGSRWLLGAQATQASDVVALESRCLLEAMRSDPALGFELASRLLRQLYDRLERVRLQRLDVYQDAGSSDR